MDKLQKLVSSFLSEKFEGWKPYLTKNENYAFELFYIKKYSIVRIAQEMDYSDRQISRLLKSARDKINKRLMS